ncbi:hypothetical protein AB0L44_37445 [Nonomuraea wenchangensis]|uniref:hypothetical protein n=1 Tax=Nonomuraea wenchangensis TaxID=568860 RepID=UPI003426CDF2
MRARKTALLRERFAAVDPGLMRLASAMRAVLGAAASLTILAALGQSGTALLAGGFTAMVTSLAISDLHPHNQLITLGLWAPVSLAALAAGAVLRPYPVTAAIVFLLLIYLAVRTRRYGARGQGVGVFGFMGFFLAQFAGARASELPAMGGAVVVAFCASWSFRQSAPRPRPWPHAGLVGADAGVRAGPGAVRRRPAAQPAPDPRT